MLRASVLQLAGRRSAALRSLARPFRVGPT